MIRPRPPRRRGFRRSAVRPAREPYAREGGSGERVVLDGCVGDVAVDAYAVPAIIVEFVVLDRDVSDLGGVGGNPRELVVPSVSRSPAR